MDIIFVDTSAWYALANEKDINHSQAQQLLTESKRLVTMKDTLDHSNPCTDHWLSCLLSNGSD